jgi:hypothetical protein
LFILGARRSGTTQVLRLCRDVYGYCGGQEGQTWASVKALDDHLRRLESELLALSNTRLSDFTLIRLTRAEIVARYIATLLEMHIAAYGSPVVDKAVDPESIIAAPLIAEALPNARFVFLRRRGIENVWSQLRRFPDLPFKTACLAWARTMKTWRETRERLGDRALEIDQREIGVAPEVIARALTNFLGHGDADAVARYLASHFPEKTGVGGYSTYLSLYATGWDDEQRQTFCDICSDEMTAYGYSLGGETALASGERIDFATAQQVSRWILENGNSWIVLTGPGLRLHPNFGGKGPVVLRFPAALTPGDYKFEADIVVFDARCRQHRLLLDLGPGSAPTEISIRLDGAMQGRVEWSEPKISIRVPTNLTLSVILEDGIEDAAFSATQIVGLSFSRLSTD